MEMDLQRFTDLSSLRYGGMEMEIMMMMLLF
jgi:hypothetical protein